MDCITNYLCCCFVSETDTSNINDKEPLINNNSNASNRITSRTMSGCQFLKEMDDLDGTKLKIGINNGLDIALKVAAFYKSLVPKADEDAQEGMNAMCDQITQDIAAAKRAFAPTGSATNIQTTLDHLYKTLDALHDKVAAIDLNPKTINLLDADGNINVDEEEEDHPGNITGGSTTSSGSSHIDDGATLAELDELQVKINLLKGRMHQTDNKN